MVSRKTHAFCRLTAAITSLLVMSAAHAADKNASRVSTESAQKSALLSMQSLQLFQKHKIRESMEAAQQALAIDPDNPNAYFSLGVALAQLERWEQAINYLSIYIKKKPNEQPWVYKVRAEAYQATHKDALAMADANKCVSLSPHDPVSLEFRAGLYSDAKKYDLAINDLNKAMQFAPKNSGLYADRGSVYRDKGQLAKAIADYSKAIELQPAMTRYYGERAKLYQKIGKHNLAQKDFEVSNKGFTQLMSNDK